MGRSKFKTQDLAVDATENVQSAPSSGSIIAHHLREHWVQALAEMQDAREIGQWVTEQRELLMLGIRPPQDGIDACRSFTALADAVVRRLFQLAIERSHVAHPPEIAVAATGGYGRMELSPHSDIDITFIPERDGDAVTDRIIREIFRLLMDVMMEYGRLKVGYAYRLIEDCATLDHTTQTTLVDARLVAGSRHIFARFLEEFWVHFNPTDFLFRKIMERRQVRSRFGTTPYLVEPNIKEGAGGLRDIHLVRWLGAGWAGLPTAGEWEQLVTREWLTPEDADHLIQAQEFLLRVRNHLHILAGEQRDVLTAAKQEQIAARLGYQPRDHTPAVEHFMHDYYRHAADAHRICEEVIRRVEHGRHVLGIGLDCERKEVIPAQNLLQREDPVWMVWAVRLAQEYELSLSMPLQRLMQQTVQQRPSTHDAKHLAETFLSILRAPSGVARALRQMADTGVLGWILPEFEATRTLIPYDPSHEFTVGEHTLRVIENIEALNTVIDANYADYRRIFQETPHREILYLAALLHDAGKANPHVEHGEAGAQMAQEVGRRLQLSEDAIADLAFLVRHHLLMAETSRLRDLNLDETIRDFVHVVDTIERLNMLYILTYADTHAVGSGQWTEVKAAFLRELHRKAERFLVTSEAVEHAPPDIGRFRRRLAKELSLENLPEDLVTRHLNQMPATYLLNTPQEQIGLHIRMVQEAIRGAPQLAFQTPPDASVTELTVCTIDDPEPGLLAKIAGVLYAGQVAVHAANVFTRSGEIKIALDTLWVDYRGRPIPPSKRAEIEEHMVAVLTGEMSVSDLLQRRRRVEQSRPELVSLVVHHDLSEQFTVIEVRTTEHIGMLYWVCRALSRLGWNIHSAKLSTWAGKAVGVFYITDAQGNKIRADAQRLRDALAEGVAAL
ncbi:MAG: HD domain-containing protein [Armatimonadota bacterium]|nr:HD domain-containing protein [bacterium]MDW8320109.1 HD domain-containing protein [Armatimonadota bacterium]